MLPRFARDRVREADPRGHVALIQVRPKRLAPTIEVDAWDLSASQDHGSSADRAVTLFQYEHLAVLESLLGRPVSFNQTRRNVAVSGFNLEVARGSVLSVGDALLEPTGRCHPCARMEESLGSGGFAAMFGHGGWTARIIESGVIRRGDTVRLHIADT